MVDKIFVTRNPIGKEDLLLTGQETQSRSGQDVTVTGLTGTEPGDFIVLEDVGAATGGLPAVDGSQLTGLPSGTNIFLGLIDAPNDYATSGLQLVRVNAAENAVEFADMFQALDDDGHIATQLEAEAGLVNNSIMTPLRVAQAIDAQVSVQNQTEIFNDGVDFTAGTTTQLTLAANPDNEDNTDIFFDGLKQHRDTYTLAGGIITFDAAIPLGTSAVEITSGTELPAGTIADNTVTFPKLNPVIIADRATAEAGTATDKLLTPERVAQAIAALPGMLNDGYLTFPKLNANIIADQATAEAGTASDKLMTPERVAQAIAALAGGGGYKIESIVNITSPQNEVDFVLNANAKSHKFIYAVETESNTTQFAASANNVASGTPYAHQNFGAYNGAAQIQEDTADPAMRLTDQSTLGKYASGELNIHKPNLVGVPARSIVTSRTENVVSSTALEMCNRLHIFNQAITSIQFGQYAWLVSGTANNQLLSGYIIYLTVGDET